MIAFTPYRELVMKAFKYSLMLQQYPMVQITEGLQREIRETLDEVITLLAESLWNPTQPRCEVSIKLDRAYARHDEAVEHALERLYTEAGVMLARARCIPLCWPEPEKIYHGFGGRGEELVGERGDWITMELKLTIPVLKP